MQEGPHNQNIDPQDGQEGPEPLGTTDVYPGISVSEGYEFEDGAWYGTQDWWVL